MHGCQDQLELGPLGVFRWEFSIQNSLPQLEVVGFSKEHAKFGQISWLKWALAQSPILHPHNHEAQDRVWPLGLKPIISSHAGNLWAISYWGPGCVGHSYMLQWGLWGLQGKPPAWLAWLLQWLSTGCPKPWACSQAKTYLTRHPHWC